MVCALMTETTVDGGLLVGSVQSKGHKLILTNSLTHTHTLTDTGHWHRHRAVFSPPFPFFTGGTPLSAGGLEISNATTTTTIQQFRPAADFSRSLLYGHSGSDENRTNDFIVIARFVPLSAAGRKLWQRHNLLRLAVTRTRKCTHTHSHTYVQRTAHLQLAQITHLHTVKLCGNFSNRLQTLQKKTKARDNYTLFPHRENPNGSSITFLGRGLGYWPVRIANSHRSRQKRLSEAARLFAFLAG